ncbi:MAG: peptide ABC transporter ATP-binding protein [Spirochaetes bacterium RBG_16_49_21]|nr:MAG: peptide ABC transporter ATP-binding protein [Spirochaetes bacterium RBG_16_49_21]
MTAILDVQNLGVRFPSGGRDILAVRDVSFTLYKGSTLGFVGESGCGKSVTAYAILKLVPQPGIIDSGRILYQGRDILRMDDDEIRKVRGKEIAMIFQEPMISLNPVFSIGYQISESIMLHLRMSKREAREYSIELLKSVGIPDPGKRYNSYPHEFSGGMRQRVMIAIALSASPSILIADEPTTALDVTIQAQILEMLLKIQEERQMSLLLITHDLGIVANIADEIAIMYAGEIAEYGRSIDIFKKPGHPYTRGLFKAIPRIGDPRSELATIPGMVPSITSPPTGCVFYPRCPIRIKKCIQAPVPLLHFANKRLVRCIRYKD